MDIVFDCPNCSQELAVDSSGAGSEIECPSCGETITIPAESTKVPTTSAEPADAAAPSLAPSAIASSAAAKVTKHLKVPVRDKPGESLIKKSAVPLEAIAKGADKRMRIHSIRHSACIESGHDKFDEVVSKFLNEVGEANIISIHTISYTYFDVGTQKILNDYGVIVIYRG
jgi:DNA-directed RNA polymerase subunit RPC12/RpoP